MGAEPIRIYESLPAMLSLHVNVTSGSCSALPVWQGLSDDDYAYCWLKGEAPSVVSVDTAGENGGQGDCGVRGQGRRHP